MDSSFHLIIQGNKVGPIDKAQVMGLIKHGKIFFNDLILVEGKWLKIHQHNYFGPHFSAKQLPRLPSTLEHQENNHEVSTPPDLPPATAFDRTQTPADLVADLAFVKHAKANPEVDPSPVPEHTGPFNELSKIFALPDEVQEEKNNKLPWYFSTWQDWLLANKKTVGIYAGVGSVVLILFFTFGPTNFQAEFDGIQERELPQRMPASTTPTGLNKKGRDTLIYSNDSAEKEYAPGKHLPVQAKHSDENGLTIIRYVPDARKIDQAIHRKDIAQERAKKLLTVGEDRTQNADDPAPEDLATVESTEYERARQEIEDAREDQAQELEALKEQEIRRQEQNPDDEEGPAS